MKYRIVIPPARKGFPDRVLEITENGKQRRLCMPDEGGSNEFETDLHWHLSPEGINILGGRTFKIELVEKDKSGKKEKRTIIVPEKI